MQEWVATTGVRDRAAACSIVALETWLTSTSMPSRFISATAARPECAQSAMQGGDVAEIGPRIAAVGQGVVAGMGQGHVAGAQRAELRQHGDVLADRVAVFHRRDDGDGAIPLGRFDLGCGGWSGGHAGPPPPAHAADRLQHAQRPLACGPAQPSGVRGPCGT